MKSQTTIVNLTALLVLSLSIGALVWYVSNNILPSRVEVIGVRPVGIGAGGCNPELITYYDSQGRKWIVEGLSRTDYREGAPLYNIELEQFLLLDPNYSYPCYIGPEVVDPTLVLQGETYYPYYIDVSSSKNVIFSGESMLLTTTVRLTDNFSRSNIYSILHYTPTNEIGLDFSLSTTTFDVSPQEMGGMKEVLSLEKEAKYYWVISPKEQTLGRQELGLSIKSDKSGFARAYILIDVKPIIGLPPYMIALVASLGSFLLGLLGILNILPDIWSKYTKGQQEIRGKGRAKGRANRKL